MALVLDLEGERFERSEALAHLLDAVHGRTFLYGRTEVRANTPCSTYGSCASQASASASDGNSAITRLPWKPAGPGSGESMAGIGPATNRRPSSRSASR